MNEKKIEPTDAMVEAGASSAWEEVNPGILGWNSISERHKEGCRWDARAVLTAALNHPGIAGVYDYGETADQAGGAPLAYLVMELVNGEPLNAVLSRLGHLSQAQALDLLEQTGRALQVAQPGFEFAQGVGGSTHAPASGAGCRVSTPSSERR